LADLSGRDVVRSIRLGFLGARLFRCKIPR